MLLSALIILCDVTMALQQGQDTILHVSTIQEGYAHYPEGESSSPMAAETTVGGAGETVQPGGVIVTDGDTAGAKAWGMAGPDNGGIQIGAHGTTSWDTEERLNWFVRSTWFGLASGMASIFGLLVALWGSQIRTLPYCLYRSLVWRRSLLLALGTGLAVFSAVNFYLQPGPPVFPTFMSVAYLVLHGFNMPSGYEPGTSVWCFLFFLGFAFLIWGFIYNPITIARQTLLDERAAFHTAYQNEVKILFGERLRDELTDPEKQMLQQLERYYAELQMRFLDVVVGSPVHTVWGLPLSDRFPGSRREDV